MDRRAFLKTLSVAGAGSMLSHEAVGQSGATAPGTGPEPARMPTREFGRTGVRVPIPAMGMMFDVPNNHLLLRRALQLGVTYWDTADCYEGGRSEESIGQFFESNPDERKRVFLVTKSDSRDPAGMTRLLQRSLERMKTDWIDLYFLHGVKNIGELNDDTRRWAENAKREGKMRFFGFSTHANMEACMEGAAQLGWIDALMIKYDFRLMRQDRMKRAVEACVRVGIGLTAMKTQGGGPIPADADAEGDLAAAAVARGFTPGQAKLKAVWSNPAIASICSQMPNVRLLNENAAAAMDRRTLSKRDEEMLDRFAHGTATAYCAGCAHICEAAAGGWPVADLMRCWVYERSHGMPDWAREEWRRLWLGRRAVLALEDLRAAEAACPNRLPIVRLAQEALERWA